MCGVLRLHHALVFQRYSSRAATYDPLGCIQIPGIDNVSAEPNRGRAGTKVTRVDQEDMGQDLARTRRATMGCSMRRSAVIR